MVIRFTQGQIHFGSVSTTSIHRGIPACQSLITKKYLHDVIHAKELTISSIATCPCFTTLRN